MMKKNQELNVTINKTSIFSFLMKLLPWLIIVALFAIIYFRDYNVEIDVVNDKISDLEKSIQTEKQKLDKFDKEVRLRLKAIEEKNRNEVVSMSVDDVASSIISELSISDTE